MRQQEQLKTLEFHARLAEKAAETEDLHLLVEGIISETVVFMNATSGSIMVFDPEENCLKLYVSSHHPGMQKKTRNGPVARVALKQGIAGQVFATGRPVVVESAVGADKSIKLSRKNDSGSFLSAPLKLHQKMIGVMNLNRSTDQKGFTEEDLVKLKSVDTLIAGLIEKENLLQTIENNRREIASLYSISCILASNRDFVSRLVDFLVKLSDETGLERSAIIELNPQFSETIFSANGSNIEILAAHRLEPSKLQQMVDSVAARLRMQLQKPAINNIETEEPDAPLTLSFEEEDGARELFCLPLVVEDKPSHLLLVSRRHVAEDTQQAVRYYRFLYLISQNLAMAIARNKMFQRIEQDKLLLIDESRQNEVFLDISKDLASTLDPVIILQKAFVRFRELINFTTIGILLFDDIDNNYRLFVQPGESISQEFQKKLADNIFELFSDYPADPALTRENFYKPSFFNPHNPGNRPTKSFKHVLHLPIIISDRFRGLIHLSRGEDKPFTTKDLDITSHFTGIFITSIKNALIHKRTEKLAFTDPLTELFNHRYFQETLAHEFIRARRYSKPLSLMVIDIDFFKKFNDTWGHLVGDQVLRHVAAIFKNSVREQIDTVARYGGEEFAFILPETSLDGAKLFAERIRSKVEQSRLNHDGNELSVTLSIGVSCTLVTNCEKTSDLIEAADQALYKAKASGRNKVLSYEEGQLKHEKH